MLKPSVYGGHARLPQDPSGQGDRDRPRPLLAAARTGFGRCPFPVAARRICRARSHRDAVLRDRVNLASSPNEPLRTARRPCRAWSSARMLIPSRSPAPGTVDPSPMGEVGELVVSPCASTPATRFSARHRTHVGDQCPNPSPAAHTALLLVWVRSRSAHQDQRGNVRDPRQCRNLDTPPTEIARAQPRLPRPGEPGSDATGGETASANPPIPGDPSASLPKSHQSLAARSGLVTSPGSLPNDGK